MFNHLYTAEIVDAIKAQRDQCIESLVVVGHDRETLENMPWHKVIALCNTNA